MFQYWLNNQCWSRIPVYKFDFDIMVIVFWLIYKEPIITAQYLLELNTVYILLIKLLSIEDCESFDCGRITS